MVIIENLWSEYIHLKDYPNSKNKTYWDHYNTFLLTINMVPDFIEMDNKRLKRQETLRNCTMSEEDQLFHELQIQNPPTGYCYTFISRKWKKSQEQKKSQNNQSCSEYYEFTHEPFETDVSMEDNLDDPQFQLEEEESTSVKKKKFEYAGVSCSTKHDTWYATSFTPHS